MRAGGLRAFGALFVLTACVAPPGAPALVIDSTNTPPSRATLAAAPTPAAPARAASRGTYVVRGGDTLSEIAVRERVDMGQLARLNGLSPPYTIRAGQTLVLPGALTASIAPTGQLPLAPVNTATIQGQVEILHRAPQGYFANQVVGAQTPRAAPALRQAVALPPPPTRAGAGFAWPMRGEVVSTFGAKGSGVANDGIDIRAALGTPVVAVDNGVVAYASDELKALGNLVLIQHEGGWVSAYANAGSLSVKRGDVVTRGQQVATAGQTGNAKHPGIHFELRKGTQAVDPMHYLSAVTVAAR
ncbi:MAG: M23 family metallopeptidase [Alphaproteobacteria bacterium]|nr:M23 family metallopeptidase [Alphaproteobacteria bacterium]